MNKNNLEALIIDNIINTLTSQGYFVRMIDFKEGLKGSFDDDNNVDLIDQVVSIRIRAKK